MLAGSSSLCSKTCCPSHVRLRRYRAPRRPGLSHSARPRCVAAIPSPPRTRERSQLEPLPLVVLVERLSVVVLIPHRVRNDIIEPLEPCTLCGEARLSESVADGEERIRVVVQEHVHLRHGEGDRVYLLPIQLGSLALLRRVLLLEEEPRLDEQTSRAAGRVVDGGVGLGVEQVCHQPADLFGRVELTRRLALPLGKLPQQVLVGSAEDVRLGVLQPQPVAADDLNEGRKPVVIEGTLAALSLVVVLDVQNAEEFGVVLGNVTHRVGDELAERSVSGMVADCIPAVLVGDEEADDGLAVVLQGVFVVGLDDLTGDFLVAELRHLPGELVVKHVRESLEEDQRQNEVLEFGGVRRPPDGTCGVPQPRLQRRDVKVLLRHGRERDSGDLRLGGLLACLALTWIGNLSHFAREAFSGKDGDTSG